ncbi:signal peptidase I [Stereum hirsutum FP-91666 SS1]|uniref:signal peptidase I n=1 Tax=Stereum hirsutum (strain FP-91666) TaxID=721885 RepID=UPI0004409EB5|nr:signal peptidase I [Stereum hirsutum FP-91666 SS1]EIM87494.1 signal peptidase I [Stereum hirsutum FP-91666 SS1]
MKTPNFRQTLLESLRVMSFIIPVYMIWIGLGLVANTESPIVVVLSGSMEPAFYRGDLLFLTNPLGARYQTGDIVVYKIMGEKFPIVHRILETHDVSLPQLRSGKPINYPSSNDQLLLTKGDNNPADDIELYRGLEWLERKHVVGKVRGFLPYVGYVTIAMNDFPRLKYALFGVLGLMTLLQRE